MNLEGIIVLLIVVIIIIVLLKILLGLFFIAPYEHDVIAPLILNNAQNIPLS